MTLGLDTPAIASAAYTRLASDSVGATLRSVIGSSPAMIPIAGHPGAIFDVVYLPRVRQMQIPPIWAAFEDGSATGRGRMEMRTIPYDWWFYAPDSAQGKRDLRALAPLVDALYKNVILATGRITCDLITAPTFTSALTMYAMRARLFFTILR